MNPIENPFAPGAGKTPPALIGRELTIQEVSIALSRLKEGRNNNNFILVGLRGVGKTVLLRHLESISEKFNYKTIWFEASEGKALHDNLIPALKNLLEKMSFSANMTEKIKFAGYKLNQFAAKFKLSYQDVSLQVLETKAKKNDIDYETELFALLEAVCDVAKEKNTALTIHIDEMQFIPEDHLQAFFQALHLLGQKQQPILFIGAGLPQIRGKSGVARSYAERLFSFQEIGRLSREDSQKVIEIPANEHGVYFEKNALEPILARANGYPFFLQQYGSDVWNCAPKSPITTVDSQNAIISAEKKLDEGFFKVRFERLTPLERRYLRAMAELSDALVRSGDIAAILGKEPQQLSPTRNNLLKKGVLYSPAHGDSAFTVPLFGEFLKRTMPLTLK